MAKLDSRDNLEKLIKDNGLEELIDKAFCEVYGLHDLGSNDEGHTSYNLDDYWNFARGYVRGWLDNSKVPARAKEDEWLPEVKVPGTEIHITNDPYKNCSHDVVDYTSDPPYVEDCRYFNNCESSRLGTCRGCNTWIAKYHIDRLPALAFNGMFDCYCLGQGSQEAGKVLYGKPCIKNANIKCTVQCQYLRYARKST